MLYLKTTSISGDQLYECYLTQRRFIIYNTMKIGALSRAAMPYFGVVPWLIYQSHLETKQKNSEAKVSELTPDEIMVVAADKVYAVEYRDLTQVELKLDFWHSLFAFEMGGKKTIYGIVAKKEEIGKPLAILRTARPDLNI